MANPLAQAGAVTGLLMLSSAGPNVSRSTNDGHSDAVRWAQRKHSHFINLHDYTVTTLFTHLEVIFAFSSSRKCDPSMTAYIRLEQNSTTLLHQTAQTQANISSVGKKSCCSEYETLWMLLIRCVTSRYTFALLLTAN